MKKTFIITLLSMAFALSSLFSTNVEAATTNPNKDNHVVFYIPHQDDEALTFGVAIMNHVRAGYQVHVVLLTDGSASVVRKKMGMTEKQFTIARNKEFVQSVKAMGVKYSNISFMRFKDSQLTVEQVEKVIKSYEAKYPGARHKTFSWTDKDNHDHSNAGIALQNVQKAKITNDARYYVRRGDYPKGLKLTTEKYYQAYNPKKIAVSRAYSVENKKLGLYGIGRKSVRKSFEAFDKQPLSRYHK